MKEKFEKMASKCKVAQKHYKDTLKAYSKCKKKSRKVQSSVRAEVHVLCLRCSSANLPRKDLWLHLRALHPPWPVYCATENWGSNWSVQPPVHSLKPSIMRHAMVIINYDGWKGQSVCLCVWLCMCVCAFRGQDTALNITVHLFIASHPEQYLLGQLWNDSSVCCWLSCSQSLLTADPCAVHHSAVKNTVLSHAHSTQK